MKYITCPHKNFAIFSDIHFGKSKDDIVKNNTAVKFIDYFIDHCHITSTDAVIFTGDWFDNRNSLSIETINIAYDCLKKIAAEFPIYMILGNHDTNLKATNEVNSIRPFSDIKNITLIDNEVTILNVVGKSSVVTTRRMMLCPWGTDVKAVNDPCDFAFGHFEYNGAALADGVDKGCKFNMSDLNDLAPVVFTGHYHINKQYNMKNGTVISVGSPMELDWGDYGNKKYMYILNTDTGIISTVENTISPKHVKYSWSSIINQTQKVTSEDVTGNYVNLVIDDKFEYDNVNKVMSIFNDLKPARPCDVDYMYNYMKDISVEVKKEEFDSRMTNLDYMKKCIGDIPIDKLADISIDKLIERATEYHTAVDDGKSVKSSGSRIIFKKLVARNFLSIGPEIVFDFTCHSGINYVWGKNLDIPESKNGCGKSTLKIDAILYTLFGETAKKIDVKYIPNRRTTGQAEGELTIEVDGHIYLLEAGTKSKKSSYFRLHKDGIDITKSSVKETRDYFEKEVIKTNFELFKNTVTLTTCNTNNFFQLSKAQRRTLIESIFSMDVFGKMLKNIRTDINSVDKDLLIHRNNVSRMDNDISRYTLENTNFKSIKEQNVKALNVRIEQYNKEITKANDMIEKLKKEIADVPVVDCSIEMDKFKDARSKLEATIGAYRKEIGRYKDIKAKYDIVLREICNSCYSKVAVRLDIGEAEKHMTSKTADIEKYTNICVQIDTKVAELAKKQEDYKKAILNKTRIEKDIIYYEHSIVGNKKSIEDVWKSITVENDRKPPFDKLLEETNKKMEDSNRLMKELSLRKKYLDILSFVVDEEGAKKYIIKDLVEVLNGRIHIYLKKMGSTYTCIFDEAFSCEFLTETGPCSYENFSAGEKTRINISVVFAFRDILAGLGTVDSSILVMDEFIDSALDQYAINAIIQMSKEFVSKGQTVFLISHRECFNEEDFNNIIQLQKHNGFTSIVSDRQSVN